MFGIDDIKRIVVEASALMVDAGFEVREKDGVANIVTSSDVAVERLLVARLRALAPGSAFLLEEDLGDTHGGQPSKAATAPLCDCNGSALEGCPPYAARPSTAAPSPLCACCGSALEGCPPYAPYGGQPSKAEPQPCYEAERGKDKGSADGGGASSCVCVDDDRVGETLTWVIDPIDGTANYARGMRDCAVSVGLRRGREMVMGVVYAPRTGEMFWAERGGGAWMTRLPLANGGREHTPTTQERPTAAEASSRYGMQDAPSSSSCENPQYGAQPSKAATSGDDTARNGLTQPRRAARHNEATSCAPREGAPAMGLIDPAGEWPWGGVGERLHCSARPLSDGVLCTALPVYHKEAAEECGRVLLRAFARVNDLRRFGSAALELCYLAAGRVDLYFEYLLSPWDFAAAALIVEEAGGTVSDREGRPLTYESPSAVVAGNNAETQKELLEIAGA